jgi:hypothetical protein
MSDSPRSSRLSLPPAESRLTSRPGIDLKRSERASRLQMGLMLALGLVVVAVPLYLLRRPKFKDGDDPAAAASSTGSSSSTTARPPDSAVVAPVVRPAAPAIEVKVVSCTQKGKRKLGDECDHVASIEEAFAKSAEESLSCFRELVPGESLVLTANVAMTKKKVTVTAARTTEKTKLPKASRKCVTTIREAIVAKDFSATTHGFAAYKYSVILNVPKKDMLPSSP